MLSLDTLKKRFSWESMELSSLLGYYRYVSLFVTSGLYLAGPPLTPIQLKAGITLFLVLEAFAFTRLYNMERQNDRVRKFLVFFETLGLAGILILTGGLDSPFLWYAINPILLAATLLPAYFCWMMMSVFVVAAVFLQRFVLGGTETTLTLWPERHSFILIFVMMTLAAQIFNHFIRRVTHQAELMEEQLGHIKSLYEAVEVFSNRSDLKEIINLFASYTKTMTGAQKVILWVENEAGLQRPAKKNYYAVKGFRNMLPEKIWYPYLKKRFEEKALDPEFHMEEMEGLPQDRPGFLLTVNVKSKSQVFGLLSAFFLEKDKGLEGARQTLSFMADLCAVALEKRSLESKMEDVLLLQEKDRIARELHDNVTQNLFGLIYGIDLIIKKNRLPEEFNNRLRLLQKTTQNTLKELRTAIYQMSSLKGEQEPFVEEVQKYLRDLAKLNNIEVTFHCNGHLQLLLSHQQHSLFRIIREATGNAIRHGHCSSIQVKVEEAAGRLILEIADNGGGFDPAALGRTNSRGLGLINMKELTRSMGSELQVVTGFGQGTRVYCEINLGKDRVPAPTKEESYL